MIFRLSAGNKHDAPEGRKLIESFYSEDKHYLLMDRAYEDNETRELAVKQGFVPVVPPKRNRKNPWEYDKELYKRRNEVERYFLRIKRFRRVFTRYDKLDVLYLGNLTLAVLKIKPCKRNNRQNIDILNLQPKRATLRSDPTQAAE